MKGLKKFFKNVLRIIAIVLIIIAIIYLCAAIMAFAGALGPATASFLLPTLTVTVGNAGWLLLLVAATAVSLAYVVDQRSASAAVSNAVGGLVDVTTNLVDGAGTVAGAVVGQVAKVAGVAASALWPYLAGAAAFFLLSRRKKKDEVSLTLSEPENKLTTDTERNADA